MSPAGQLSANTALSPLIRAPTGQMISRAHEVDGRGGPFGGHITLARCGRRRLAAMPMAQARLASSCSLGCLDPSVQVRPQRAALHVSLVDVVTHFGQPRAAFVDLPIAA